MRSPGPDQRATNRREQRHERSAGSGARSDARHAMARRTAAIALPARWSSRSSCMLGFGWLAYWMRGSFLAGRLAALLGRPVFLGRPALGRHRPLLHVLPFLIMPLPCVALGLVRPRLRALRASTLPMGRDVERLVWVGDDDLRHLARLPSTSPGFHEFIRQLPGVLAERPLRRLTRVVLAASIGLWHAVECPAMSHPTISIAVNC